MKTWSEYLGIIRMTNGDTKTPYKVSNDEYLVMANMVLPILSRDAGAKKSTTLSGNGPTYSLPEGFVHDRYIIADDGNKREVLKRANIKPGNSYGRLQACPTSYAVRMEDDDTLTLMSSNCSDAVTYKLYYNAEYSKIDENGDLPVSGWKEVALMYLIIAYSLSPIEYKRAKLEQYASAPELKVANPPAALAELYRERYKEMIAMQVSS